MRAGALARLIVLAGLAAVTADGVAQAATRIRLAQTSNVTNCMMSCNAQVAQCQTTCLVPRDASYRRRNDGKQRQPKHVVSAQLRDATHFLPDELCADFAVALSL